MDKLKNSQRMVDYYPFFYKDSSIISNHLEKLDEKNNLSDTSEIVNSKNTKDNYQNLESFYKIDDGINQRIITQLEEENQNLLQMTKLQQQRIERLEEQMYDITGGRLFF